MNWRLRTTICDRSSMDSLRPILCKVIVVRWLVVHTLVRATKTFLFVQVKNRQLIILPICVPGLVTLSNAPSPPLDPWALVRLAAWSSCHASFSPFSHSPPRLSPLQGRFVMCNTALAELYATTPPELVGRHPHNMIHDPANLPSYAEMSRDERRVLEEGVQSEIPERLFVDPQGRSRWFRAVKQPFTLLDGSQVGALGSLNYMVCSVLCSFRRSSSEVI